MWDAGGCGLIFFCGSVNQSAFSLYHSPGLETNGLNREILFGSLGLKHFCKNMTGISAPVWYHKWSGSRTREFESGFSVHPIN